MQCVQIYKTAQRKHASMSSHTSNPLEQVFVVEEGLGSTDWGLLGGNPFFFQLGCGAGVLQIKRC